ncbi:MULTISPECIES: helix-turn-helix transcriptional regulator [unclassified Nocardioides]|uniref:helix-turn-helix transcriptional regulator n=1 Tax=unclassified Nocardioides TaxID=2615069 RepID=UPI000ABFB3BF|nr:MULTISPECIES: LuxR family transcriptional regulator [unclassified Nocardioides]
MAVDLVGRSELLDEIWRLLREGPRVVCITGEPGVGKSSVLGEVAARARADSWSVLAARGRPSERSLSYAGAVDLLRTDELELDPGLRSRAEELVETLVGRGDERVTDALSLRLDIAAWLRDLAGRAPVLVLVDDQQWLDDSSWSVLSFVANRLAGSRVSFLVATRDAAGAEGLEDLPALAIAPLDLDGSMTLLEGLGIRLDPVVRTVIVERAQGNPLALREFARTTGSSLTPSGSSDPLDVPPRVEAAFAAELPGLPPSTRAALLLAAAGASDIGVLERVLGVDGVGDLEPAEAVGLVSVVDGHVRFRHPLVRSTIYTRASARERVRAHRDLADAYVDDPARRVWHRAGASLRADEGIAGELMATAFDARDRGAHSEAARAMLRAAELSPSRVDRESRMLEALMMLGHTGHVARLQAISERIREESDDPTVRARAAHQAAYAMAQTMRQSAALDALEGSLEEMLSADADAGWAALTTLASLSYQTGKGSERVRGWYDRFAREAPATPGPMVEMTRAARTWIEVALAPLSRPPELVARVRDTPPLDLEIPMDLLAAQEVMLGAAAWLLDETEVASRRLEKGAALMRRSIGPVNLAQTLMALGQVQFDRGAFAEAADTARELIDLAEARSLVFYRLVGRELLARVTAVVGSPEAARVEAEAILRALDVDECAALEANLIVTLARAAFAAGDLAGSARHARALFRADGRPLHPHVCLRALGEVAQVAVRAGERDAVAVIVERARARLEGTADVRFELILQRALAALAEGDEAEAFHAMATSHPQAATWPFELAHAELGYGTWLRRQRRPAQARDHLATARDAYARLGVHAWAAVAEAELRAAGVAQAEAAPASLDDLTPQERQIVLLAGRGLTNREIGKQLFLSPRTVSTHLYHAFPKLGVTSRAQLRGLLDPSGD